MCGEAVKQEREGRRAHDLKMDQLAQKQSRGHRNNSSIISALFFCLFLNHLKTEIYYFFVIQYGRSCL